jgi:hypothetical protein
MDPKIECADGREKLHYSILISWDGKPVNFNSLRYRNTQSYLIELNLSQRMKSRLILGMKKV